MRDLLLAIMLWFGEQDVYFDSLPVIAVRSPQELHKLFGAPVLGLYDRHLQILYISTEIDLSTPFGASVLVHELYHHYQTINNETVACHEKLELNAYLYQKRFLESLGEDSPPVLSEFNIMMRSACSWELH